MGFLKNFIVELFRRPSLPDGPCQRAEINSEEHERKNALLRAKLMEQQAMLLARDQGKDN
jgi:hypothetical protein